MTQRIKKATTNFLVFTVIVASLFFASPLCAQTESATSINQYDKACSKGDKKACDNLLSTLFSETKRLSVSTTSLDNLNLSCDLLTPQNCYEIGVLHLKGYYSKSRKDQEQKFRRYSKDSCAKEFLKACYEYGRWLEESPLVEDQIMASQFYLKACHFQFPTQRGYIKACYRFKRINNIEYEQYTVEQIDRIRSMTTQNLTYEQIMEFPCVREGSRQAEVYKLPKCKH